VLTSGGTGAAPTWSTPAAADKISEGNTSAEVIDTGSDGRFVVTTEGTERMRLDSSGRLGVGAISPAAAIHIATAGQTTPALNTAGSLNLLVTDTGTSIGNGGSIVFGFNAGAGRFAAIKGHAITGGGNSIGDLTFATRNTTTDSTLTERLRIASDGFVGIGTTSPAARLHVDGTIRYTNRPAAGTITAIGFDANGDLKASSSSLRYKHDVENYEKGLDIVMQLRPVSFKFNGEENTNIGFIAEEVDELGLAEVMLYNEDDQPEGIIYANMVSLLTKAIQQQQSMIGELQSKVAALEAQ
jgi:hypothetical protein